MKNNKISLFAMLVFFYLLAQVWAANSLVSPDDISLMKRAGITDAIIEILTAEQTSSVNADTLLRLREAGGNDKLLKQVILGDRYKSAEKDESSDSVGEILKSNGFSEASIQRIMCGPEVRKEVDSRGDERIIYRTGSSRGKDQPESSDSNPQYYINIERVGKD